MATNPDAGPTADATTPDGPVEVGPPDARVGDTSATQAGNTPEGGPSPEGGSARESGAALEAGSSPEAGAAPEAGNVPEGGTEAGAGQACDAGTCACIACVLDQSNIDQCCSQ